MVTDNSNLDMILLIYQDSIAAIYFMIILQSKQNKEKMTYRIYNIYLTRPLWKFPRAQMQVKAKRDSEEEVKMPKDRSCPLRETAIRRRFSVVNNLYFFPLCPAAWGKDKKIALIYVVKPHHHHHHHHNKRPPPPATTWSVGAIGGGQGWSRNQKHIRW